MRTIAALALSLALAAGPASAATGAQFLRLGAGARSAGMGDAFTAVADDATALYWNPAGLAFILRPEIVFAHAEQFGTVRYETVHAAAPVAALGGTLGFGFTDLTQDEIQTVSNTGAAGAGFKPTSLAVALGYGQAWWVGGARLGAGGAAKLIQETLHDASASAFAADLGAWAEHDSLKLWRAGATIRHMGTKIKFLNEAQSLPTEFSLGAYRRSSGETGTSGSAELVLPGDGPAGGKMGVEHSADLGRNLIGVARVGYQTVPAQELGAFQGLTFGGGVRFASLDLDFSYQSAGELGQKFRLGGRWRFGVDGDKTK